MQDDDDDADDDEYYIKYTSSYLKRTKSESFLQMTFSLAELLTFGITSNPENKISQRND